MTGQGGSEDRPIGEKQRRRRECEVWKEGVMGRRRDRGKGSRDRGRKWVGGGAAGEGKGCFYIEAALDRASLAVAAVAAQRDVRRRRVLREPPQRLQHLTPLPPRPSRDRYRYPFYPYTSTSVYLYPSLHLYPRVYLCRVPRKATQGFQNPTPNPRSRSAPISQRLQRLKSKAPPIRAAHLSQTPHDSPGNEHERDDVPSFPQPNPPPPGSHRFGIAGRPSRAPRAGAGAGQPRSRRRPRDLGPGGVEAVLGGGEQQPQPAQPAEAAQHRLRVGAGAGAALGAVAVALAERVLDAAPGRGLRRERQLNAQTSIWATAAQVPHPLPRRRRLPGAFSMLRPDGADAGVCARASVERGGGRVRPRPRAAPARGSAKGDVPRQRELLAPNRWPARRARGGSEGCSGCGWLGLAGERMERGRGGGERACMRRSCTCVWERMQARARARPVCAAANQPGIIILSYRPRSLSLRLYPLPPPRPPLCPGIIRSTGRGAAARAEPGASLLARGRGRRPQRPTAVVGRG